VEAETSMDPSLAPEPRGRARTTRTRTRRGAANAPEAEEAAAEPVAEAAPEAQPEPEAAPEPVVAEAEEAAAPAARAPRARGRGRRAGIGPAGAQPEVIETPESPSEPEAEVEGAEEPAAVYGLPVDPEAESEESEDAPRIGRWPRPAREPRERGGRDREPRGRDRGRSPRGSSEDDLESQIDAALQQQRGIPPRPREALPPREPVAEPREYAPLGRSGRDSRGRIRETGTSRGRRDNRADDGMRDRRQIPEQPRGPMPRGGSMEAQIARQNVLFEEFTQQQTQTLREMQRLMNNMARGASGAGAASGGALMALPKVGIFLDVPNLIYAAEQIGARIHFGKLLDFLTEGRQLVRATAYAPITDDPSTRFESQRFIIPVLNHGYKIVTKPWKRFADGGMKANFDIELAVDILTMSDRLDIVVLLSGDGDFRRVCELVESKGVRVEVVSFAASTAMELRSVADSYIDVGSILHMLQP
jgi:uncharacterized LabA/DUF88 family protein